MSKELIEKTLYNRLKIFLLTKNQKNAYNANCYLFNYYLTYKYLYWDWTSIISNPSSMKIVSFGKGQ